MFFIPVAIMALLIFIFGEVFMRTKNINMLSGPITKGLISLSIPIMVMNIMTSVFNLIDMTALRIFSDESAVGAVGACGTLITLCISLLVGTSVGASVIVAKRIGAGDKKQTEKAVTTALLIALLGSVVLLGIGATFSKTFLEWINCPAELLPRAANYLRIYFYGLPFYMFYTFCASILRAMGDTKRPMYFMILGGAIKVVFTVLFVTTLDVDVEGAAFSTMIANVIESSLAFFAVYKTKEYFRINLKKFELDLKAFKEILQVGIPTGITVSSISASLHVKACIHVECRTSKALCSLGTCCKTSLAPVIVEEVDISHRLVG